MKLVPILGWDLARLLSKGAGFRLRVWRVSTDKVELGPWEQEIIRRMRHGTEKERRRRFLRERNWTYSKIAAGEELD